MIDIAVGPFVFDTSAESWLLRSDSPAVLDWLDRYRTRHPIYVSSATVLERVRGYNILWLRADPEKRTRIDVARLAYLDTLTSVLPVDSAVAVIAAEITTRVFDPPSPPRKSHQLSESRQDRLVRWRFDAMIAATAVVAGMPLVHNNARDFEAIRDVLGPSSDRRPQLGSLRLVDCRSLL
jgi:predicted nucleic acid-binding protein